MIPTTWTPYTITSITPHNHDTSIFTFALPNSEQTLGLPVCGCILLLAPDCEHGGGDAIRPYTPTSPPWMKGQFQLLIKRYAAWGEPRFIASYRPAGAVSNYLHGLRPGDEVRMKHVAVNVKLPYVNPESGVAGFEGVDTVTMIAVGVGLAPMVQALHAMLANPDDTTRIIFLYGSRSVKDVLMRQTLDEWAEQHPDRFKVVYYVGSRWRVEDIIMHYSDCPKNCGKPCSRRKVPPPEGFDTLAEGRDGCKHIGWVDMDAVRKHAFPPAPRTRVFVCGLPGVYDNLCGPRNTPLKEGTTLHRLGYTDEMVGKIAKVSLDLALASAGSPAQLLLPSCTAAPWA